MRTMGVLPTVPRMLSWSMASSPVRPAWPAFGGWDG
jgi:hypothetical protein